MAVLNNLSCLIVHVLPKFMAANRRARMTPRKVRQRREWQREDASGGHKQTSGNYQILPVWILTVRAEITMKKSV